MVLLISSIGAVQSTSTCNSFPKIFGGSSGTTFLYHIDAFNDHMALAGITDDNSLTGITSPSIPYLALASISGGGKYYWVKALSLKTATSFVAV
jgi:hypothetical protein